VATAVWPSSCPVGPSPKSFTPVGFDSFPPASTSFFPFTHPMNTTPAHLVEHAGEANSNQLRHDLVATEPLCLRTRTTSLAVLARSAGSYHYTPEGRKLADFTSGVLVANLGHHPKRWWKRVLQYMQLENAAGDSGYHEAVTLTSYNAVTPVEMEANRRLLASLQAAPGGKRLEQVLWAASGSEAVQKGL